MPNKEYEIEKKERERKDKKASIIIFSTMVICLVACLTYIVMNG